ncbi:MAG: hypothetical protein JO211_07700 [Acidobacteriaceae bacterium]|nr:hypothetical protein [Acidobacteriaceae bacterium]
MKTYSTLGVLLALAFAVVSPLTASETRDLLKVHVPFAFFVAGQEFAPGDYVVHETNSGIVSIQGGGKGAMVLSYQSSPATPGSVAGLRFAKNGQKAYLIGVQSLNLSSALPLTRR